MQKKKNKKSAKTGLPPGTLFYTGTNHAVKTKIEFTQFNEQYLHVEENLSIDKIIGKVKPDFVNWINITGLTDTNLIQSIGNAFNIHPLLLEDILDTEHQPKVEEFSDYLFFTLRILNQPENEQNITSEQISLILGKNYVVTFLDKPTNIFDPIIDRIKNNLGKTRKKGNDYLLYLLVDSVVDRYFEIIENLEDQIEDLETRFLNNAVDATAEAILEQKKQLLVLKKAVHPFRDEIRRTIKTESDIIDKMTIQYLSDIYDHLNHISESIDGFKEITASLIDLHLSNNSMKMNNVMKVLTVVSTIFMPLTFLAGIYGMNFKYMPELELKWSYPIFLTFLLILGFSMYFYMKRKKWF